MAALNPDDLPLQLSFENLNEEKEIIEEGINFKLSFIHSYKLRHPREVSNSTKRVKVAEKKPAAKADLEGKQEALLGADAKTPSLHVAVLKNQFDFVEELLKSGVDYNALDEEGKSPFFIALNCCHDKSAQMLVRYAVGPPLLCHPNFIHPLHWAVKRGMIFTLKEMILAGFDVNHENEFEETALHICLNSNAIFPELAFKMLKVLILNSSDIDINKENVYGLSPLFYAAFHVPPYMNEYRRRLRSRMVNFLIAHGADVTNVKNFLGFTLLQHEYNSNNTDVSVLLACIQTFLIPPPPGDLFHQSFDRVVDLFPDTPRDCSTYMMSNGLGLTKKEHDFINENIQPGSTKQDAARKQRWYQRNIFYDEKIPALKHLTRYYVRSKLGIHNLRKIKDLGLPKSVSSFLLYGSYDASDMED